MMDQNCKTKIVDENIVKHKKIKHIRKSVFVLLLFVFSFSFFSYAFSNEGLGVKDFFISFNGESKDVDAVIIDGYTYVKLRDITDNTTLDLYWNEDTRTVDVVDSSFIIFEEFDGVEYINLTHFRDAYTFVESIDIDVPYGMYIRNMYVGEPEVAYNSFFVTDGSFGYDVFGFSIPSSKVLYKDNSYYMEYEFFKENLGSKFIDVIYTNEKSKDEN